MELGLKRAQTINITGELTDEAADSAAGLSLPQADLIGKHLHLSALTDGLWVYLISS